MTIVEELIEIWPNEVCDKSSGCDYCYRYLIDAYPGTPYQIYNGFLFWSALESRGKL